MTRLIWELIDDKGVVRLSVEVDPTRNTAPFGIGMSSGSVVLLSESDALWLMEKLKEASEATA